MSSLHKLIAGKIMNLTFFLKATYMEDNIPSTKESKALYLGRILQEIDARFHCILQRYGEGPSIWDMVVTLVCI